MCTSLLGSSLSQRSAVNRFQVRCRQSKKRSKGFYDPCIDYDAIPINTYVGKSSGKNYSPESSYDGYIHGSCQLTLLPGCAYLKNSSSELSPEWDEVFSVRIPNKGDLACPICLHSPVAPRMGKCGHVYCWPCVTQYIKYENDSTSKKCAVCSCLLPFDDLKRVSLVPTTQIKPGDNLDFALVRRSGSEVTRRSATETDGATVFQCVCVADIASMMNFNETETNELLTYKTICEIDGSNTEIIPFIDLVLDKLKHENCALPNSYGGVNKLPDGDTQSNPNNAANDLYFYQVTDGQPIYLDGLAWRCLLTEYGDIKNLPEEISTTVVTIKNCRMNPFLRKRLRYLNHLPNGYAFSLVEIELEPPLVSEATLAHYATVLNNRAMERDRSRLEDLKLTELKEAAENQFTSLPPGFVLSGHVSLSEKQEQPKMSDFVALSSGTNSSQKKSTLPVSFAEVSRAGALSVVGPDRVAHFSRSPPKPQTSKGFNINSECWPTLGESSKAPANLIRKPSNVTSNSGE
ncbi:unnamed protein product [Trichobilharzia szidati]|nr:unnamed protein product [Trichobilharzia szidati]CAH8857365.1 unnamed protein product [Trichobilharzia szidati]